MKEIVKNVIKAFGNHGSNISSESKGILATANEMLTKILADNLDEQKFKEQADIIIVGAILAVYIREDLKYGIQKEFGDKYLYPRSAKVVGFFGVNVNIIANMGRRALIEKVIPFTGTIDYRVFPLLGSVGFSADHFAQYKLNTDPATMDTSKISKDAQDEKAQSEQRVKEQEKERQADQKWQHTFGLSDFTTHAQAIDFKKRKHNLLTAVAKQDNTFFNEKVKLGGIMLVSLLLFPTLLFSIPWAISKYKAIKEAYDNASVSKRTFSIEEYVELKNARQHMKDSFDDLDPLVEPDKRQLMRTNKPRKVCVGLDAKGKETHHRGSTKTVVMYTDKAQAKRWNLGFLKTVDTDKAKFQKEYAESLDESLKFKI